MENIKKDEFYQTFCSNCDFERECDGGVKCAAYELQTNDCTGWADDVVTLLNKLEKLFQYHPSVLKPYSFDVNQEEPRVFVYRGSDLSGFANNLGLRTFRDEDTEWVYYCNVKFYRFLSNEEKEGNNELGK